MRSSGVLDVRDVLAGGDPVSRIHDDPRTPTDAAHRVLDLAAPAQVALAEPAA